MKSLLKKLKYLFDCFLAQMEHMFYVTRKVIHCSHEIHVGSNSKKQKNLCVYAHFDADGTLKDYVLHSINQIKRSLDCDLVFVSTGINTEEIPRLKNEARLVILRENIGYDFGSWSCGMRALGEGLGEYEKLILCNSSIVGPFNDLKKVKDKMLSLSHNQFLGITESWQRKWHLQSYFLVFPKSVFSRLEFKEFFENVRFLPRKISYVHRYEVGLSQMLTGIGLKPVVMFPSSKGDLRNPILEQAVEIFEEGSFPFFKESFLKKNSQIRIELKGKFSFLSNF